MSVSGGAAPAEDDAEPSRARRLSGPRLSPACREARADFFSPLRASIQKYESQL